MEANPEDKVLARLEEALRVAFMVHENGISTYAGGTLLIHAVPRVVVTNGSKIDFNQFEGQFADPRNLRDVGELAGTYSRHAVIFTNKKVGSPEAWNTIVRPASPGSKDGIKVEVVPRTS